MRGWNHTPQVVEGIRQQVAGAPPAVARGVVWVDVRRFYEARMFAPRWVRDGRVDDAVAALRVVQRAPEHGLVPADYGEADLSRALSDTRAIEDALAKDPAKAAQLDVRVTTALLALGRDVAVGRGDPAAIDPRWKARREPPDFAGTLSATTEGGEDEGAIDTWLDRVRPRHPNTPPCRRRWRISARRPAATPPRTIARSGWPSTWNGGDGCPTISARATSS